MRRAALMIVIATALAACGGESSGSAPTTARVPLTTQPPPDPPVAVDRCEDAPDPAQYQIGVTPTAVRPCTVPEALGMFELRQGTGRNAVDGDTLIVDYVGIRADDGSIFDDTYSRNVPFDFVLGRGGVIQGWDDGLIGLQAGSAVKLDVPAILAYGDHPPAGVESIQPGDALTFVIEVHAVIPTVTGADAPLDLQLDSSVGALEVSVVQLESGDGATAKAGDTVVAHMLLVRGDNQVVLVNTWDESDPLQIVIGDGGSLPGVVDSLAGARVGDLLAVTIPPSAGFGPDGATQIGLPSGTDLIVVIDVMGVY